MAWWKLFDHNCDHIETNNLTFDETIYGVGIRSVIAATNKYDGMYDFTAEDGIFSAKISLNMK